MALRVGEDAGDLRHEVTGSLMTKKSAQSAPLATLTQAELLLSQAASIDEVSKIKDLAEAARVYAQEMKLGTSAVNYATKIKVRAEKKMADLVDGGQESGEIATKRSGGRPKKHSHPEGISKPKTLKELGVSAPRLHESRLIRDYVPDEEIEETFAKADEKGKEVSRSELLKKARKRAKEEVEHTPARPDATIPDSDDGRISLLHGDFRERLTELEPGSVDLILTDPPYPKENLPLWYDLAKTAKDLLAPRGLLIAYTGQIFFPEVLQLCAEGGMTYGWTFALTLPGSGSRIMGRHMIQAWKPVIAFSTGTWPSGEWADDLLVSPERTKVEYEWQQNVAPAKRLIERFSAPDGLVVDPFLGVGSFGVAAKELGRRFVGVELDAKRFKQAQEKVL